MDILIENGTLITHRGSQKASILIKGGKIHSISKKQEKAKGVKKVIDARDCYVFPGGIDVHTHMELPVKNTFSSDTFSSGTLAALKGGTTTIIDFANQSKGKSLISALKKWEFKAQNNCYTDYSFHLSITDVNSSTLNELEHIFLKKGITSFKTFLAYPDMMISENDMRSVMSLVKKLKGLVTVHAEDGQLIFEKSKKLIQERKLSPKFHYQARPPLAEEMAISKVINLARITKCPVYIVHLSTKAGLEIIKKAQADNVFVLAETCPQYLLLNNFHLKDDPKTIMSPPLRNKQDNEALWEGIKDGSISVLATDHCPFTQKQKNEGSDDFRKIPNGVPGVEHRVELLHSEGVLKRNISLKRFVEVISTNPAKIFGLYPQKGSLQVGADADLLIFDPSKEHTISRTNHHMNCDYSIYEGYKIIGQCRYTIINGHLLSENSRPRGRYLFRKCLKHKLDEL